MLILSGAACAIEFFADKIPWLDSVWDSVHTFIRPIGAGGTWRYCARVVRSHSQNATRSAMWRCCLHRSHHQSGDATGGESQS